MNLEDGLIWMAAVAIIVAVLSGLIWGISPSGVGKSFTTTAYNTSVVVVLHPATNLSMVGAKHDEWTEGFCPAGTECAINGSSTIHVTTAWARLSVLETYAHELEHLRLQERGLTTAEEHEIIERKNTVLGMRGAFWNWPAATWEILPWL